MSMDNWKDDPSFEGFYKVPTHSEENNTLECLKQLAGEMDVWMVIKNLYKYKQPPYQRIYL